MRYIFSFCFILLFLMVGFSEEKIIKVPSNDDRSYHVSSKKISNILGFVPNFTIQDAVVDIKRAFEKKLFKDPLSNEMYFNIKRMKSINLV